MPRKYDASSITQEKGLRGVYARPGMYIGSTDAHGLHHLLWEVLDNSIDEAMVSADDGGVCDRITVTLHDDGSVSVSDNGRGIPVRPLKKGDTSPLVAILTELHTGGKLGGSGGGYAVSGGLHGVGLKAVSALSLWVTARVTRDGEVSALRLELRDGPDGRPSPGEIAEPVRVVGKPRSPSETGTEIRFLPNPGKFSTVKFDAKRIAGRMRDSAYLNPGVRLTLRDERGKEPEETTFRSSGGIAEYVSDSMAEHLASVNAGADDNQRHSAVHASPILIEGQVQDQGSFAMAMQWRTGRGPDISSFANSVRTVDGGVHETGALQGVRTALTKMARRFGKLKDDQRLDAPDIKHGLHCVVSARVFEPEFFGQTKSELRNADFQRAIASAAMEAMTAWIEEHPVEAEVIIDKAVHEMQTRKRLSAAELAAANKGNRGRDISSVAPSSKLADCRIKDPSQTELFLVEGDSAGGSGKAGRDKDFQAILPFRGKSINPFKKDFEKVYSNQEVLSLIAAVGTGTEDKCDISKANYRRFIILSDADPDGGHIVNLLLALFWTLFRPLVEEGRVFIAKPPLYGVRTGEGYTYLPDRPALTRWMAEHPGTNPRNITRFKGLGEMNPDQLGESTLNPETRLVQRVTADGIEARIEEFFTFAMSNRYPASEAARAKAYCLALLGAIPGDDGDDG